MACETPKQSRVVIQAHNPNQSKGHANKDNNIGDETTYVEDSDKTQSIEDQNELEAKLLENKNDKNTDASDDNLDANANSKEDGDLINHDNETPNIDEDEISVDDNYEKFEVIEGYNDENRSTKDDPNHHNVEEENLEDSPTHKDINVLQVVAIQYVRDQMVPMEQLETRSSDKDENINHLNIFIQNPIDEINTLKGASSLKVCDEIVNEESLTNQIELSKLSVVSTTYKKSITNVTEYPTMLEGPSIDTKESIFQILISAIPRHAKILEFNMLTQVHHEDIILETQNIMVLSAELYASRNLNGNVTNYFKKY